MVKPNENMICIHWLLEVTLVTTYSRFFSQTYNARHYNIQNDIFFSTVLQV